MIQYITTHGVGNAWVANEVHRLQQAGLEVQIAALHRDQHGFFEAEWARRLDVGTKVLYPIRVLDLLRAVITAPIRFGGRYWSALWNALTGPRESFAIRLKGLMHLAVACLWASDLRQQAVERIHSQWIHSGGTVGMFAARLLGIPFSFTGHAADLFRERCALRDKIHQADRIVCISEFHRRFFLDNGARPEQLVLVYCGIDVRNFVPMPRRRSSGRLEIRASGRLVEKKGFALLIDACALLRDRGVPFRCVIGGSGPLEASLRQQITALGLESQVELPGVTIKQERISEFMAGGDVYCLPCVWAADGDVDGLPQMLMEAMACGLAAVSTRLVGIPDLVIHEETGLLVDPSDVTGLADALSRLANDPTMRQRIADEGRSLVDRKFNLETCLDPLITIFKGEVSRTGGDAARTLAGAAA